MNEVRIPVELLVWIMGLIGAGILAMGSVQVHLLLALYKRLCRVDARSERRLFRIETHLFGVSRPQSGDESTA